MGPYCTPGRAAGNQGTGLSSAFRIHRRAIAVVAAVGDMQGVHDLDPIAAVAVAVDDVVDVVVAYLVGVVVTGCLDLAMSEYGPISIEELYRVRPSWLPKKVHPLVLRSAASEVVAELHHPVIEDLDVAYAFEVDVVDVAADNPWHLHSHSRHCIQRYVD